MLNLSSCVRIIYRNDWEKIKKKKQDVQIRNRVKKLVNNRMILKFSRELSCLLKLETQIVILIVLLKIHIANIVKNAFHGSQLLAWNNFFGNHPFFRAGGFLLKSSFFSNMVFSLCILAETWI